MICSVYAAQYLLEGLFRNSAGRQAVELMTAPNDRSWRHMIESGTTITWEAWDQKYKPNQDWNHAWGAAPANLLPRYVLGVQPLSAGWETALIRPCVAGLSHARGKSPTPRGPIHVAWKNEGIFRLSLKLPKDMTAMVELPVVGNAQGVYHDGKAIKAKQINDRWILDEPVSGIITLEVK